MSMYLFGSRVYLLKMVTFEFAKLSVTRGTPQTYPFQRGHLSPWHLHPWKALLRGEKAAGWPCQPTRWRRYQWTLILRIIHIYVRDAIGILYHAYLIDIYTIKTHKDWKFKDAKNMYYSTQLSRRLEIHHFFVKFRQKITQDVSPYHLSYRCVNVYVYIYICMHACMYVGR